MSKMKADFADSAYAIARVLGTMHMDGLDVDPEALAIGQRLRREGAVNWAN
jgi:hypothetical protein